MATPRSRDLSERALGALLLAPGGAAAAGHRRLSDRDAVLEQPAHRRPGERRGGRDVRRASPTTRARSTTSASGIRPGTRSSTSSSRCPGRCSWASGSRCSPTGRSRVKWPVRLGLLLPWALPLVFAGLIFRWFFEYNTGVVNNWLAAFGIEPLQWLSSPTLAFWAICIAIVWKASSFMALMLLAGLQTIPEVALRGGGSRRRVEVAAIRRDHAADAAAGDLRRADLPHDHRDADVRHPVRDDRRRAGRRDRDARDVHPQDDARLPRLRLRLRARGADVRASAWR